MTSTYPLFLLDSGVVPSIRVFVSIAPVWSVPLAVLLFDASRPTRQPCPDMAIRVRGLVWGHPKPCIPHWDIWFILLM